MILFSINPSASLFVFGDFSIHYKDWLTYFSGTDRPGELFYNFSITSNVTQMFKFPTWVPDLDFHSSLVFDLFLSSDASICNTMVFPTLLNLAHVVVSVYIYSPSNSECHVSFHCVAYDYLLADCDGLHDHLKGVPWEDVFKLSASAAASELCKWTQIGNEYKSLM